MRPLAAPPSIPGKPPVTITLSLATAIHCGQIAAGRLHDVHVLPAHVILAALADKDTAAARWLDSYKRQAAAEWLRHLGDRIFRTDLREMGGLGGLLLDVPPGAPAQVHNRNMVGAVGNGRKPPFGAPRELVDTRRYRSRDHGPSGCFCAG